MASILDYLKAQGVDTDKLYSSKKEDKDLTDDKDSDDDASPSATDKLTNSAQSEVPVPDVATPVSPEMLGMPPSGPNSTVKDGQPNFFQDPNNPIAKSGVPLSPEMLGLSMGGPNSSPLTKVPATGPSPASQDEEDDDSDDGHGGSAKSSVSMSFKGSVADQQAAALQAAINGGGFTNNTVAGLKAAQDEADSQKSKINLLRGLSQIATGALGANFRAKTDNSATIDNLKGLDKEADQKVQDFKDRGEQEKNDPKSALSVGARSFAAPMLAKMGMSLPDNISYNGMEKLSPQLTKLYDTKTAQENQAKLLQYKYSELNAVRDSKNSDKANQQDTKRLDTVNKMITSGLASSRSGFGKDASNLMAVQNAKALLDGGNLDDIDTRQIAETSRVLDRILSNGAPTQSGTEHLTPETARMKIAKQLEFYTNQRQGAGAGSFLKNTLHTLDREENIAKQRTQATMQQALGSYKDIAQRNPEAWDSMVSSHPEIASIMNSAALKQAKLSPKTPSADLTTPSGYPKTVVNKDTGKQALVSDPTEEKEAKEHGFE